MESEGERAQWEGEEGESAGQDTSREPPVLPVDGTDTGPSEGAAQGQPQAVRAGGGERAVGAQARRLMPGRCRHSPTRRLTSHWM